MNHTIWDPQKTLDIAFESPVSPVLGSASANTLQTQEALKVTGEVGSPDVMSSVSEDNPFQRRSTWHIWAAAIWKTTTLLV